MAIIHNPASLEGKLVDSIDRLVERRRDDRPLAGLLDNIRSACRSLLAGGGYVEEIQGYNGRSLIHYLCFDLELKVDEDTALQAIKVLTEEFDLPVNIEDDSGAEPIVYAVGSNRMKIADYLLDRGADINSRDEDGATPLMIALHDENMEAAHHLLDRGAAVDRRDISGEHVIHYSTRVTDPSVLKRVLEAGVDPLTVDYDPSLPPANRYNALNAAASEGLVEHMKLLIDAGCPPDGDPAAKEADGFIDAGSRPVIQAVEGVFQPKAVVFLANQGADLNANGQVLDELCEWFDVEDSLEEVLDGEFPVMLGTLTDNGMDPFSLNRDGETLLDAAMKKASPVIQDALHHLLRSPKIEAELEALGPEPDGRKPSSMEL